MIRIIGAGKDYPLGGTVVRAFDDVNLEVEPGEIVSIVGPSGCGKSSLLKAVAGLEPLSRGRILLEGEPVTRPDPRIGVVFQEARLLPWLTVRENAALPTRLASYRGPEPAGAVEELLRRVGLDGFADAYPSQISGGMAQRAALARTLLQRPAAILFDEPFASLDALRRMELQRWLAGFLREEGVAVLFVTHDLDEAVIMGDRVAVMASRPGRILRVYPVPREGHGMAGGGQGGSRELWALKDAIFAALQGAGDPEKATAGWREGMVS